MLTALAVLLALPYWLVQAIRYGKYHSNLKERLGLAYSALPLQREPRSGAIWLHAVSVGEVLSGVGLARRLKERYPERPLIVSTTTLTGQAVARERMPFADALIYFPLDWGFAVRRAFRAMQPQIVVILETEIWPNFLREAQRQSVPVAYISGRLSSRSFARYQRWMGAIGFLLRPFLKRVLSIPSVFLMQTEQDAARVRTLGAPADHVSVGGNLKYDLELPTATPLADWLEREAGAQGRRPLVVAGSVVANEENLALIAFGTAQGEHSRAFLVLAPRKPERFEAAAAFINESHRKFVRRSALQVPGPNGKAPQPSAATASLPGDVTVLLLDSIGELASLYRVADVVFVGGSLVPSGGHNILEPAAFGKIPVFGPHTENFAEMTSRFVEAGAAIRAESPEDVGVAWIDLLKDPPRMQEMGARARRLVEQSRGATSRALEAVERFLTGAA
jgi:3-deoxy-D-manno-octulosonic-acid transferase